MDQETANTIKRLQDRYIRKAERVQEMYDNARDQIVKPGLYQVVESDYAGMNDAPQFVIEVVHPITMKDLTLRLIDKKDYMSPWGHLQIRPYYPNTHALKV